VTSTVAVSHSAGSQIRRFTVEYPSSTSFFKLSTMAGSRSPDQVVFTDASDTAFGGYIDRARAAACVRSAIEEATKVEVEDGNVVKAGIRGACLCARCKDGYVV
jgi:hypothetical protein